MNGFMRKIARIVALTDEERRATLEAIDHYDKTQYWNASTLKVLEAVRRKLS